MNMTLKITYADGRVEEVSPTPGDLVRLEREFDVPAAQLDGATTRIEHLMFLAWSGLKRTGREARTFDEFLDDLAEVGGTDVPPPQPSA